MEEKNINQVVPEKKKRGRKPKVKVPTEEPIEPEVKVQKKRGRKPKGGKIISNIKSIDSDNFVKTNVVLHLKCSLEDLNSELSDDNKEIQSFNLNQTNLDYEVIENNQPVEIPKLETTSESISSTQYQTNIENEEKLINIKLKSLQKQLHTNDISDKKSACFWCTYGFDNPPIYIPKYKTNDNYFVYGCFCSPECSVSHLMNENIDTTEKFERYQLLNFIYSKIYNYKINIKPAPNPHYVLDKYYGNLTIQEYRKLLRNDRLLMIIDKPLTRILPELHEENNDFLSMKNSITNNSAYQIKKKTKISKSSTSIF
uniref:MYM-type domain-containing protein n=1 Tax=viral metagenome TaxID=1070528 RepID=A0A6C0AYB9_9ZZZZ|tara:strand:- start:6753 stop:7691 length:939 start_codon:yes stop_codon:yes gene_type:complete